MARDWYALMKVPKDNITAWWKYLEPPEPHRMGGQGEYHVLSFPYRQMILHTFPTGSYVVFYLLVHVKSSKAVNLSTLNTTSTDLHVCMYYLLLNFSDMIRT